MTGPHALRSQEVCDADRLIAECRDLGNEPSVWHRHMLAGLARLFGVLLVAGGEGFLGSIGPIEPVSFYGQSDDSGAEEILVAYHHAGGPVDDPALRSMAQVLASVPGQPITRSRRQLVADEIWYQSTSFEQFRRPADIDELALSVVPTRARAISAISFHGVLGGRELNERELSLLYHFHTKLGRLIGGPLVGETEPGPEPLSRRLRQTLACLLEGDGEKQVGARLGLSLATVHQYVTRLYRYFGVGSRAQLLTHVMKRMQREPWSAFCAQLGGDPLAIDTDPRPESLSPRLRQTLACLLEGDSEKQVAARLSLSHATIHQYVTALYRHFGVSSRAQLVTHVMRRVPASYTRLDGAADPGQA